MKNKYLLMAAMILPCTMFTACGGGDDGGKENSEQQTGQNQIVDNVSIEQTIDQAYTASLSEIQKAWAGEYEGWDDVQKKNTNIRRLLTLNPNNTYTNVIQGVLIESGKSDYVDFEHEKGRYSYNSRTKTITYTVESDSVLDYGKQKFVGYSGKKYYDHTDGNYNENVQFSYSTNGTRKWITRDTYLQSLTDMTISIAFAMDPQNPNDDPRR